MRGVSGFLLTVFLMTATGAVAGVPMGVLPFKGDGAVLRLETSLKTALVKAGGVTILADSVMKEIIRRHEQAQSIGSACHDISQLKVAEYLLEGALEGGRLQLKVVDVNSGAIVLSDALAVGGGDYRIRSAARRVRKAVILHASGKKREVPEDVGPYMEFLQQFVKGLGRGKSACYPYLAFYYGGKYRRPSAKYPKLIQTAGTFLKVVRPSMVRSRLVFVDVKSKAPWVYISVVAVKLGKKTMHRFGIIELSDGSLGVSIYEPDE